MSKFALSAAFTSFWMRAIQRAVKELSPRVVHTNSWSRASSRWNAGSVLKNPEAGSRLPRQEFLALYGKTHCRVQKKGKRVDVVRPWSGARTTPTTAVAAAVATADAITAAGDLDLRMAEIKGYAVANPYDAQTTAWAARAAFPAPKGIKPVDPGYKGEYTTPAAGWVAPSYTVSTPVVAARVIPTHRIAPFVPATLTAAVALTVSGVVAPAIAGVLKAHKAERRRVNRAAFTLAAVIALIATRKGTAKAGGVGFTAFVNVAFVAAVATAIVAVAASVGNLTVSSGCNAGKSMNINQQIARRERVKRQRRNSARRKPALTSEQRQAKRQAAETKRYWKMRRRAEAKARAARVQSENVGRYSVITRAAKSAALREGNNAVWLANGTEAPIPASVVKAQRAIRKQEEAALPASIRFRRAMAEGTYNRRKDGQKALGYEGPATPVVVTVPVDNYEKEALLAEQAYLEGEAVIDEILNGSESEVVSVAAFALEAKAIVEEQPEAAKDMTMSWNRRTPAAKTGRTARSTSKKTKAAPKMSVEEKQELIVELWEGLSDRLTLDKKLDRLTTAYNKEVDTPLTRSTVEKHLCTAMTEGLTSSEGYLDVSHAVEYFNLKDEGLEYKEILKELDVTSFEISLAMASVRKEEEEPKPKSRSNRTATPQKKADTEKKKTRSSKPATREKADTEDSKTVLRLDPIAQRHKTIAALWKPLNKRPGSLEVKLERLYKSYCRKVGSSAQDVTIHSYLACAYAHGLCGDVEEVLPNDKVVAVLELLEGGLSLADIAAELNITYFEVVLAGLITSKEETVPNKPATRTARTARVKDQSGRRQRRSKELDLTTTGSVKFTTKPEALGCIPAFTVKHVDAPAVDFENDPIHVIVSRYNSERRCNANAHFGDEVSGDNADEILNRRYAPDNSEVNVPISNFLGFDNKDEEKQGWTGSTLGATPARICAAYQYRKGSSMAFTDAAYTNVAAAQSFGKWVSHHLNFESLVGGEHDLKDKVQGRREVGATAAVVRNLLRQAAYTGDDNWIDDLEAHGQTILVHNALEELEADDEGIVDPRDGTVVGDHYLLIVARVSKIVDARRAIEGADTRGEVVKGQLRPYADHMTVYFVPTDVVEDLFDLETPRKDNNYFTFLDKEEVVTKSRTRKTKAPAKETAPTQEVEKESKPEVRTRRRRNDKVEPEKVGQIVRDYKDEIAALYDALSNPTGGNRATSHLSSKEVVKAFALNEDTYLDAMLDMFPGAEEEDMEAFLFGDGEKKGKVNLAKKVAYAIAYYLRSFIEDGGKYSAPVTSLPILDHDWQYEDVVGMVEIFQGLFNAANAKTSVSKRTRKAKQAKDILCLKEINGANCLMMDGDVAFVFGDNGMVYDWRGRAFSNSLFIKADKKTKAQMAAEAKKLGSEVSPYDVDVKIVSSMGMFMYFMWLVWLPTITNWSGKAGLFANTLDNIKNAAVKLDNLFKFTTDKVQDQNGAAQFGLIHAYSPFMFEDHSPLNMSKKTPGIGVWPALGAGPAKALAERYNKTPLEIDAEFDFVEQAMEKEINLSDVLEEVMHLAHSRYSIDLNYSKGQFVAGLVGHVNVDYIRKYAPNLYATLVEYLGTEIEAQHVIANSIKFEKGLKRIYMIYANSSPIKDEKMAGWAMYGQEHYMYGFLNHAGYAPVHVGPPGMSLFLDTQDEKPVTSTVKRVKYTRANYAVDKDGNPFDYSRSNVPGVCEAEWTSYDEGDGWTYVTPDRDIVVKGTRKEILCGIHGGQPINFERVVQGTLTHFRWRYAIALDNKQEVIQLEFYIDITERDMKSRNVNKCQYMSTDPVVLFNEMNPDLSPQTCKVQGLHLQDAMKMDTLFAWLFIIGCTAFHNEKETDLVKALRELIAEVNTAIVGDANLVDGKPVLIIEPASVAAGLYEPLLKLFRESFSQTRWLLWPEVGTMGKIMHTLYTNKVKANKWFEINNALEILPEIAELQGEVVVYAEQEEITDTTSILAFGLDEEGEVIEYAQRGVMFLSTPEAQVYNVELFESSTVKEAISTSVQLLSYIKALGVVAGATKEAQAQQRAYMDMGVEALYRAKTLNAAVRGDTLHANLKRAQIVVSDEGLFFADDEETNEALDELESNLKDAGVDINEVDIYRDKLFTIFAEASRNIVFTFSGGEDETALWLPSLLSFTKLTSKSDEHRDFVSMFFYEVLIPCVECRDNEGSSITLNQVSGMLNSMFNSANARKFLNGGKCATAKRIGIPNIPVGEVWILMSDDTNSLYQEMIRAGIPIGDMARVKEGVFVMSNRAPMPMGPILRVRLLEEVWEGEEYKGQRLVSFNGEEQQTETVIYEVSPVQMGIDVMSVNMDGGDYDGDGDFLSWLHLLSAKYVTTWEQNRKLRSDAIGIDMFDAECDGYAADHYNIKELGKATLTLYNLKDAILTKALQHAKDYIGYNFQAYSVHHMGVGVMYATYIFGETLCNLVRDLHEAGRDEMIPAHYQCFLGDGLETLVLVVAEVYEIMLGGFSKGAAMLWERFLSRIMQRQPLVTKEEMKGVKVTEDEYLLNSLTETMNELGANTKRAPELLVIFKAMSDYYELKKEGTCGNELSYLAYFVLEASRGRFLRDIQVYQAAVEVYNKIAEGKNGATIVNKNMALYGFKLFDAVLGDIYYESEYLNEEWSDTDIEYILSSLRSEDLVAEANANTLIHNLFEVEDEEEEDDDTDEGDDDDDDDPTPPTSPEPTSEVENGAEEGQEEIWFSSYTQGYEWLSNFYEKSFIFKGHPCLTAEGAYQRMKSPSLDMETHIALMEANGATARKIGKTVDLRSDWDTYRIEAMALVLDAKFSDGTLAQKLIATGNTQLVHSSPWDTYWGVDNKGKGKNMLGKLLMELREGLCYLQNSAEPTSPDVVDPEEVFEEDGVYLHFDYCNGTDLKEVTIQAFEQGYKTSFSKKKYSYTCAGDYFWTWNKGKGRYDTTNPDGSPIMPIPELIKAAAEQVVETLGLYEGYEAQTCLINRYEGMQTLNTHVDKDEEVDAPIVSFSFGASGVFHIDGEQFELNNNDLLVFYGPKRYAKHGYSGNYDGDGVRYNVTVRMVKARTEDEPEEEEISAPLAPPEKTLDEVPLATTFSEETKAETEDTDMDYPNVVISGSRSITELPDEALDVIDAFIDRGASFNVGDAPGVDKLVQQYLKEEGCEDVRVWFSTSKGLRTCLPGFTKKGVKGSYTQRDEAMHRNCDESLVIWDGSSPGSRKNIDRVDTTTVVNVAEIAAAKAEAERLEAARLEAERVAAAKINVVTSPPKGCLSDEEIPPAERCMDIEICLEDIETVLENAETDEELKSHIATLKQFISLYENTDDDDDNPPTPPSPAPSEEDEWVPCGPPEDEEDEVPVATVTSLSSTAVEAKVEKKESRPQPVVLDYTALSYKEIQALCKQQRSEGLTPPKLSSKKDVLIEWLKGLEADTEESKSNSFDDDSVDNVPEMEEEEDIAPEMPPVEEEEEDYGFQYPDEDELEEVPLARATSLVAVEAKQPKATVKKVIETPKRKEKKVIPSVSKLRKQKQKLAKEIKMETLTAVTELLASLSNKVETSAYAEEIGTLSGPQLEALKEVMKGKNAILTGVGGGGKSYTTEIIRHVFKAFKYPFVVVGSTGTSVMNVEGDGTLNSVFGLSTGFEDSDDGRISAYADYCNLLNKCRESRFFENARLYKGTRPILVVVDEVSMVDNRLLHLIMDAVEKEGINVQWLLVGDPMQFVPVSGDLFFQKANLKDDKSKVRNAYSSFCERIDAVEINLKENIRANGDKQWVDCLNKMRLDHLEIEHVGGNLIRERFDYSISNEAPEDAIHLFFNNAGVRLHNQRGTEKMIAEGAKHREYVAQHYSKYGNDWFKRKRNNGQASETITIFDPIEEKMTFCIGMPVMIRKNITDQSNTLLAANGSRGYVTALGKTSITVQLAGTDKKVVVSATSLPTPKDKKGQPIGTFTQIPAHPCFAMTFHKAQGLTLDCPGVIHAYYLEQGVVKSIPMVHANSLYVAFSRFTKSEHVYIATSTEFNTKLTPKQMWSKLVSSYHTAEAGLEWIYNIQ